MRDAETGEIPADSLKELREIAARMMRDAKK